jgi:hypothetical protein
MVRLTGVVLKFNRLFRVLDRGMEARFRTVVFPLRAARESVRRGRQCFPRCSPGAPRVAGRFWVVSLEVRAGPAGCGRTLCRHALPGGVVALGMYQRYRNGRSWCLLRTPHSLPLVGDTSKPKIVSRPRQFRREDDAGQSCATCSSPPSPTWDYAESHVTEMQAKPPLRRCGFA